MIGESEMQHALDTLMAIYTEHGNMPMAVIKDAGIEGEAFEKIAVPVVNDLASEQMDAVGDLSTSLLDAVVARNRREGRRCAENSLDKYGEQLVENLTQMFFIGFMVGFQVGRNKRVEDDHSEDS